MLIYLSLGANLGDREATINKALDLLATQVGPLVNRSSFYYSQPWGFDSPNDFCNLCASFETSLSPLNLLHTTQSIERQLGRTPKSNGVYQDRTIDIDIIFYGDIHLETSELTIPHPLWQQRDFVKVPLAEIMQ
ncbi:MAG: 2-amino-4-hydroxy-6-hydroxymethyldihydropteridine diphosphokinase [Paludibacteraceae bacterium]|nr:2-amino-4-hydroxy-6-hydroxymethyldihydropteridine diphosphokinase [Paludibacteraceae bacterium]